MKGIDYAWGRPGGKLIKAKGYDFVCRYLSNNSSKNLGIEEVTDLHQNDVKIVVVWETTEQRPLDGYDAGVQDARHASELASNRGMPEDKPIYFAADWDFNPFQQEQINNYYKGVNSVLGVERTGAYGGVGIIRRCFDSGVIKYGWQTLAWSHAQKDSRIHIYQYNTNTNMIGGVDCDLNESMQDDFGQW